MALAEFVGTTFCGNFHIIDGSAGSTECNNNQNTSVTFSDISVGNNICGINTYSDADFDLTEKICECDCPNDFVDQNLINICSGDIISFDIEIGGSVIVDFLNGEQTVISNGTFTSDINTSFFENVNSCDAITKQFVLYPECEPDNIETISVKISPLPTVNLVQAPSCSGEPMIVQVKVNDLNCGSSLILDNTAGSSDCSDLQDTSVGFSIPITDNYCVTELTEDYLSEEINIEICECCTDCELGCDCNENILFNITTDKTFTNKGKATIWSPTNNVFLNTQNQIQETIGVIGSLSDLLDFPQVVDQNGIPPIISLNNDVVTIDSEVTINGHGYVLIKDLNFKFGVNGKLIIDENVKATFENCTFESIGNCMWNGIRVQGKGKVNMDNCRIEDAVIGIAHGNNYYSNVGSYPQEISYQSYGTSNIGDLDLHIPIFNNVLNNATSFTSTIGLGQGLNIEGTTFINCANSVYLCTNSHKNCLKDNEFKIDGELKFPSNCNDIRTVGIMDINALTLNNEFGYSEITCNVFDGLSFGTFIINRSRLIIESNTFFDCKLGISRLRGNDNLMVGGSEIQNNDIYNSILGISVSNANTRVK